MADLERVAEDWSRGLAIVAHPDDMEFGAAAVARWTGQGKRIGYVLATSGEAGIDGMAPEEAGPFDGPLAAHAVEISPDDLASGVASLREHAAYLAGLGDHPMAEPEEFLEANARAAGARLGVPLAVPFEVVDL